MQLRSIVVLENSVSIQIQAPLAQWMELANIEPNFFEEELNADIFQLIKYMNTVVKEKDNAEKSSK